ncbi:putative protein TPRXL [Drosophila willistoni]|uniref:putative protein TPRXL n=1 Tax=Drosophila willistoni TaxID=7260 RepID=UPI001F08817E|nr:putative protein TPRXL [Drosophila willistoni]
MSLCKIRFLAVLGFCFLTCAPLKGIYGLTCYSCSTLEDCNVADIPQVECQETELFCIFEVDTNNAMASAKCAGAEVCETDANSCCKVDLCIASIVDTATTDSTTPEAITSTAPETTFSTTANSDSTTPEAITSTIANSDPTTTEVTTLTTPEATSSTTESTTTNTGSTSNEDSTISTSDGISSTPDSDSEAPTTEANGSTTEDSNSGGSPSTCTGFGVALVIGCLMLSIFKTNFQKQIVILNI